MTPEAVSRTAADVPAMGNVTKNNNDKSYPLISCKSHVRFLDQTDDTSVPADNDSPASR